MPIDAIVQKIITDANESALTIHEAAELETKKIFEETTLLKGKAEKSHEKETARLLESEKQKTLSVANQKSRRIVSTAKRKILDELYQKILQNLLTMTDQEYAQTLEKLLSSIGDKKIIQTFIVPKAKAKVSAKILAANGISQNAITFSNAFAGGLKAQTDTIEYDLTFETLVKNLKESREPEIATQLFSK